MRLARFLASTTLAFTTLAAWTQEQAGGKHGRLRDEPSVVCGTGLAGRDCKLVTGILRLALSRLSSSISGWRFVVVPHSLWEETADRFHINPSSPAFSSLGIRTTYLESNLLLPDARVDENLQRYTNLTGINKLTWVMAHEYGHILCQTGDERKASAAAGRLMYGRGEVCR